MTSRIFTVLAAVLLVLAFALVVLPPDGLTLVQGLAQMGHDAPISLHNGISRMLGTFVWVRLVVPILVRPVWMVPLFIGTLCVGVAVTTLPPTESPRRTGRRL